MSEGGDSANPALADILARKVAGRRKLARLSFAEKLDLLDAMRSRLEPVRKARELRRARARSSGPSRPEG